MSEQIAREHPITPVEWVDGGIGFDADGGLYIHIPKGAQQDFFERFSVMVEKACPAKTADQV